MLTYFSDKIRSLNASGYDFSKFTVSISDKTFSWSYDKSSFPAAPAQGNVNGKTYNYIVVGV